MSEDKPNMGKKLAEARWAKKREQEAQEALEHESTLDERLAMAAQLEMQIQVLQNQAKALGLTLSDTHETPPTGEVLVSEAGGTEQIPSDEATLVTAKPMPIEEAQQRRLPPGTVTFDDKGRALQWVEWSRYDLNPNDTRTFVPEAIPSLVSPLPDQDGLWKIKLDVNNLVCWLTVGKQITINSFFYNVYMDAYNAWRELEAFKRSGPIAPVWGETTSDGRKTWAFTPFQYFYMDEEGRPVPSTQAASRGYGTRNLPPPVTP